MVKYYDSPEPEKLIGFDDPIPCRYYEIKGSYKLPLFFGRLWFRKKKFTAISYNMKNPRHALSEVRESIIEQHAGKYGVIFNFDSIRLIESIEETYVNIQAETPTAA